MQKAKLPTWKKALTKKQLTHLRREGITSRQKLADALAHQRRTGFRCWDCEAAASRASIDATRS